MKLDDKLLMRLKDTILVLGATWGLIFSAIKFYQKPAILEQRLIVIEQTIAEKTLPQIERHERQLTEIPVKLNDIIARLDRMERRLYR